MKSTTIAGIIVAVLLVVGGGLFVASRDTDDTSNAKTSTNDSTSTETSKLDDSSTTEETSDTTTSDVAGAPTKEQVALHASEDDCWTIINGAVYDITDYIPRHECGDNILSACGVDATSFFNGDKAGQAGGTNDHSSDREALSDLEDMKIGDLAE